MANTYNAALPTDSGSLSFDGVYDTSGDQFVAFQAGKVYTDIHSNKYASLVIQATGGGGNVAMTSGAITTTANSDNLYTFSAQVQHFVIQNMSTATVYVERDATAVTGSLAIPPNGGILIMDWAVTVLHVYTTIATNVTASGVTGTVTGSGNIYIAGVQ